MLRKRISALLIAAAVLDAGSALALGLGDITMRSALNEPLKAEIRLRGADDLSADQVIVRLAPSADFDRSGIERLYALNEMHFEVKINSSGEGVVYLRTDQPVREPYLDFLLEVRWPNGRVLREYTVLLDLPTYTAEPAPAARAPATRARARPSVTPRSDGGGAWSGGASYDVRSGDTLWSIANRTRPSGVSVQDMLTALHRDNPEAFVNGDIDRLRAGVVLRVPAELSSGSGTDSASGAVDSPEKQTDTSVSSTDSSSSDGASGSDKPYLRIAGDQATDGGGSAGGEPGASGGPEASAVDVTTVQESLSAKERENAELASRVKDLEDQVKNYQRVVDLKSDGMASAQGGAANVAPAPAPSQPAPPAAEPGLLDSILENGLLLGAALLAAVLGTVGFLVARRRREAPSYAPLPSAMQRFRSSQSKDVEVDSARGREPVVPPLIVAPVEAVPSAAVAAPAVAPAAVVAQVSAPSLAPSVPADQQAVETYDPLAEADMFVAYGRHERAMEVLRAALVEDPEGSELRLKLMEILALQGEQAEFLTEYDRVLALGSDDDVQVARTLAVETGHPHWLSELDAPAGVQLSGPALAPVLEQPKSLLEKVDDDAPELSRLDLDLHAPMPEQDLHLDLELDSGSEEGQPDEIPEHDLALPDAPPPGFDEFDLGDLELAPAIPEPPGALAHPELEASAVAPLALDEVGLAPELVSAVLPADAAEDAADFDLMQGADEVETRLELAKAFIEMGDADGARDILDEVMAEGSQSQREAASLLLDTLHPG